jgi:ATP-dependent DNA helicase PIF1
VNRIRCRVLSGSHIGLIADIPRINNTSQEDNFLHWNRVQFPVVPAFAMTISKSQGQSLQRVGVYLGTHCFTHGMLYVAASRVSDPDNIMYLDLQVT